MATIPAAAIESLSANATGVTVRFADGCVVEATTEWIRDACRCPACRDETTGRHELSASGLWGWEVVHAAIVDGTVSVALTQPAGSHRVRLQASSLRCLAFADKPIRCTWSAHHRDELLARGRMRPVDERIDEIAADLVRYGLAFGSRLEPEDGSVLKLAHALGFVRETNDGVLFDIRSDGLELQTDNPYCDPVPTVQLMHCLRPAPVGGMVQFADGYAAAEHLRCADREAFALLTSTPVDFRYSSTTIDRRTRRAIIDLDPVGVVRSVHVNHPSMEPPRLSGAAARGFYEAYRRLLGVLSDPANIVEVQLEMGDVVVFDNRRVLHGCTGLVSPERRHAQRCYIDI